MFFYYLKGKCTGSRVRFADAPDGGEGAQVGNLSGNNGGGSESTEDEPSTDELLAKIARLEVEGSKNKAALDKALKEKGEITKQYRSTLTAQEQAALEKKEADEAKDARIAELETKMLIGEYTERCMDPEIGMSKDAAKKFAESLAGNDIESAFKCLAEHIKVTKSDMEQEFYKNRKDINAGNGNAKESLAVEKAKEFAKNKKAGVNADILKHYM